MSEENNNVKGTKNTEEETKNTEEETATATDKSDDANKSDDSPNFLRAMLARLGICTDEEQESDHEQVLDSVSFEGIANYIKTEKCKNIITMSGAGISTAAGIPDFRSPGSGLYDNLQQYKLPYPEAIFELEFFKESPEPFFKLAKELYPGTFKPTMSHYFIRLLYEKGLLLRHYTQNIDTLERVAGIPGEKLVEAHGTFHEAHCLHCRKAYSQQWIKKEIFDDKVPSCVKDSCSGIVKPDIVFFGENLPDKFSACLSKDMKRCDLLIIMGTSLTVQPFASIPDHVPDTTPRLLINREKSGQRFSFFSGEGLDFDSPKNYRDVAWLGSCDDGCLALADLLGWKDELEQLMVKEHKMIDEKSGGKPHQKDASKV